MKKFICALVLTASIGYSFAQNVKLIFDKASPQATYAAGRLLKVLT
jgi:hypothetical protein